MDKTDPKWLEQLAKNDKDKGRDSKDNPNNKPNGKSGHGVLQLRGDAQAELPERERPGQPSPLHPTSADRNRSCVISGRARTRHRRATRPHRRRILAVHRQPGSGVHCRRQNWGAGRAPRWPPVPRLRLPRRPRGHGNPPRSRPRAGALRVSIVHIIHRDNRPWPRPKITWTDGNAPPAAALSTVAVRRPSTRIITRPNANSGCG